MTTTNTRTNPRRLLNVRDCAAYCRIKPRTVYDYVRRKKLPYIKISGKLLFDADKIDEIIHARTIPSEY